MSRTMSSLSGFGVNRAAQFRCDQVAHHRQGVVQPGGVFAAAEGHVGPAAAFAADSRGNLLMISPALMPLSITSWVTIASSFGSPSIIAPSTTTPEPSLSRRWSPVSLRVSMLPTLALPVSTCTPSTVCTCWVRLPVSPLAICRSRASMRFWASFSWSCRRRRPQWRGRAWCAA